MHNGLISCVSASSHLLLLVLRLVAAALVYQQRQAGWHLLKPDNQLAASDRCFEGRKLISIAVCTKSMLDLRLCGPQ